MFSKLVGNDLFKQSIKNMMQDNRLVHSFIIEGEKGLGKHTAAGIIAAAAMCESSYAPCGECRVCNLASELKHPDITVYSADKSTFKISTVRKIRTDALLLPIEAKRKVFVLENTELMNFEAQNAMLKILEEPPDSVIFILLTESAHLLLTTIRSRCVTVSLREPEIEEAAEFLVKKTGKDKSDVLAALEEYNGNIGKAEMLLQDNDYGISYDIAVKLFNCLKLTKLDFLGICVKINDREEAKAVIRELSSILNSKIRVSASNGDTDTLKNLIRITQKVTDSLKQLTMNCNIQLTLTALAENIFI